MMSSVSACLNMVSARASSLPLPLSLFLSPRLIISSKHNALGRKCECCVQSSFLPDPSPIRTTTTLLLSLMTNSHCCREREPGDDGGVGRYRLLTSVDPATGEWYCERSSHPLAHGFRSSKENVSDRITRCEKPLASRSDGLYFPHPGNIAGILWCKPSVSRCSTD